MCGAPCRLLEELLQKEKEYQQVLKATLQQRTHDLELVRVRHKPPGKHSTHTHPHQFTPLLLSDLLLFLSFFTDISPPSIFHIPADHEPDKQLTDWLKEQGADADTVDKVKYLYLSEASFTHLKFRFISNKCFYSSLCWRNTH